VGLFILVVAISNLCLGYALAMFFGRCHAPDDEARGDAAGQTSETFPVVERRKDAAATEPGVAAERVQVEASLDELKDELSRYREQLTALDERMRRCADAPQAEAVEACLNDLRQANQDYLKQQESAKERFEQGRSARKGFTALGTQISDAIVRQALHVETSNRKLSEFQLEENVLAGCQRLLDETSRLVDANYALRDSLDQARIELARVDENLAPAEKQDDTLYNLTSRARLEAAMHQWWGLNRDKSRSLSVAVVDVDQFRLLNQQHGLAVGDRVLQAVSQIVASATRGDDMASRSGGQRFLLMFPDTGIRNSASAVERIRQLVESTRFQHGVDELTVTVSCAVAEALTGEGVEALVERVETTLQAAKRQGCNRTFIHEGQQPTAMDPPTLAIEGRVLPV
jgi:diguanylate cyclase (GGDEF)-like protein